MPEQFDEFIQERLRSGDPYLNYCLWEYTPVTDGEGKLRASSLLFQAIQGMPAAERLRQIIRGIQAAVGDFRSVYGIKRVADRWDLEVYFYDYQRETRVLSIQRLQNSLAGELQLPSSVSEQIPYFMFSFDLNEQVATAGGRIEKVHVYIGNPGASVSSGICYGFTDKPEPPEFENLYNFFSGEDRSSIEDKICCSVYPGNPQALLQTVLHEELRSCQTICLANKRHSCTVYFSGITVDQLCTFLHWQRYPENFVTFVHSHRALLDHLRYDVGVDYVVHKNDVRFVKSGIYGVF